MEDTAYNLILPSLHMNKDQSSLVLDTGVDLESCSQNGLALAQFFLQMFGYHADTARVAYGIWYDTSFSPNLSRPEDDHSTEYPVLIVGDLGVFPITTSRSRWAVVPPIWYHMPDILTDSPRTAALAFYNTKSFFNKENSNHSFFSAIATAVQNFVYNELCREFHGFQINYLHALYDPEINDFQDIELNFLAIPALQMLINRLPFLSPSSGLIDTSEIQSISRILSSDRIIITHNYLRNTWEVRWRTQDDWIRLNPILPDHAPTAQILGQRDFASVFHRVLPIILANKMREIEAVLLRCKRNQLR